MLPMERVVYNGDRVEVGAFRCPAGRADFTHAGPIRNHCAFVFPRTAVRIRHQGQRAFTADPAVVTFYNPHQPYTRERLDPAGDLCEWFALDPEVAAQVVRERDPAAAERPQAPFRFSHGPSDGATYLAQRFREALTLSDLSDAVGLSRFRLCRAFRQVTGSTMHAFREQLRLRAALDPLGEGCDDLTGLALDLGYSSHSHFTARFRKAFGVTPSQARARFRSSTRR